MYSTYIFIVAIIYILKSPITSEHMFKKRQIQNINSELYVQILFLPPQYSFHKSRYLRSMDCIYFMILRVLLANVYVCISFRGTLTNATNEFAILQWSVCVYHSGEWMGCTWGGQMTVGITIIQIVWRGGHHPFVQKE